MQRMGGFGDEIPEGVVASDVRAALFFTVKKASVGNGNAEHFLDAHGLGAELHFIGAVSFWFAALVFDGEDIPIGVKLDNVALARDAEAHRPYGKAASDADLIFCFVRPVMGFLMEDVSFRSETIFGPYLFQVDQCALPRAIQPVLERGKREELIFGEHGWRGNLTECTFWPIMHA